MAHTIYQTEGIVLGKRDFGEAERVYNIYTEKFGMVVAVAQGVRLLKSKLRYNLDLFAYGNFSLVAGKEIWRITDADEIKKIDDNNISLFSRISSFLLRMIKGEERSIFIWQKVKSIFFAGADEAETLAEILHNLGYMDGIPAGKREKIEAINKAIKESML
jgi:DNA repair protein RecO